MPILRHATEDSLQFQRLAQGLAPHVPDGLALMDTDVKQIADQYRDTLFELSSKRAAAQFFADRLLEHAPDATLEGRQWLQDEIERSSSAAQQVQARREHSTSQTSIGK